MVTPVKKRHANNRADGSVHDGLLGGVCQMAAALVHLAIPLPVFTV
jgi:hypothetical protein